MTVDRTLGRPRPTSPRRYAIRRAVTDGWGARRVMLGAGTAYALGLLAAAPATSLWWLATVYLVLLGPASSALVLSCQVYLNAAYTTDRGTAVGLAYSFIGLGNFVIFPLLGVVVSAVSWRAAYVVAGGLAVLLVLALLVATPRKAAEVLPPPRRCLPARPARRPAPALVPCGPARLRRGGAGHLAPAARPAVGAVAGRGGRRWGGRLRAVPAPRALAGR